MPRSYRVASAGTRAKAHSERGVSSAHLVRVRVRAGGRVRVRGSDDSDPHSERCVRCHYLSIYRRGLGALRGVGLGQLLQR